MKKTILIMLLSLVTVVSSAFASNKDGVNDKVNDAFNKEFSLAKEVSWETGKDLVRATFKLNDQILFAYFTRNGDLMAVTRNILSTQLPITLMAALKRDFNAYWISELFEISNAQGTVYYVTVENADVSLVLKSDNNYEWQSYKKNKKDIE